MKILLIPQLAAGANAANGLRIRAFAHLAKQKGRGVATPAFCLFA